MLVNIKCKITGIGRREQRGPQTDRAADRDAPRMSANMFLAQLEISQTKHPDTVEPPLAGDNVED